MIFDGGVEIGLLQPHFCLAGVRSTYILVAVAALHPETAKPRPHAHHGESAGSSSAAAQMF